MFWAPCGSGEGASGWGVSGGMGVSPHMCTHTCMQTHACTRTHGHVYMYRILQMATPMEASMFIMFTTCMCMRACICVCIHVHTCVCMYVWDTLPHIHTHPHPNPPTCHPRGGTPGISKNSITLKRIKII